VPPKAGRSTKPAFLLATGAASLTPLRARRLLTAGCGSVPARQASVQVGQSLDEGGGTSRERHRIEDRARERATNANLLTVDRRGRSPEESECA